ncbi:MAG: hypothetical protein U0521_22465 [Anaerolineae bacterium]
MPKAFPGDEALVESIRQTFDALATGDDGSPQADVTLRLTSAALLRRGRAGCGSFRGRARRTCWTISSAAPDG